MWLSKNFHLSEFTKSQTASRKGIDNTPGQIEIQNLTALTVNVLEPIRAYWKRPIMISSGYRSPKLNVAIGGSKTSQHCFGQAADIEIDGIDNCDLCRWIRDHIDYDQLILEFHNHYEGPNSGWVHVSYVNKTANRHQNLTASSVGGKTKYTPGFPF